MRLSQASVGPNCDCGATQHDTREYCTPYVTERWFPTFANALMCMHVYTALRIVKIESRFITTVDVVHNLALLVRLLTYTCTHSHTRSRTHILAYTSSHPITQSHIHS